MSRFSPGRSYASNLKIDAAELEVHQVSAIDFLPLEGDIPLEQLRAVVGLAQQRPFGVNRLLWIRKAEQLSELAQNSLLKLLEEPPPQLIVVLELTNIEALLPTLRSRVHTVSETNQSAPAAKFDPEIEPSLRACKDRSAAVAFLVASLSAARQELLTSPTPLIANRVIQLQSAIVRLNQNCNVKLVIDDLILHWSAK